MICHQIQDRVVAIMSDEEDFCSFQGGIQIKNDRQVGDDGGVFGGSFLFPEQIGYAVNDEEYLYIGGGIDETFSTEQLEVLGI